MSDDDRSPSDRLRDVLDEYKRTTDALRDATHAAHEATADLRAAVREAKAEIRAVARHELRKYLAREHEAIAAEIRKSMKG